MISFKQYLDYQLSEAIVKPWSSDAIDVEKAIASLNENAKDGLRAISNGGLLYRGFRDKLSSDFLLLDSSVGRRTSKDTDNMYQLMMDESKALRNYPSRSESFICSSSLDHAKNYGGDSTYVMVPLDGTKVAQLAYNDIFKVQFSNDFFTANADGMYKLSNFFVALGASKKLVDGNYVWINSTEIKKALAKASPERMLICWKAVMYAYVNNSIYFNDEQLTNSFDTILIKHFIPAIGFTDSAKDELDRFEAAIKNGAFTTSETLQKAYEFFKQHGADVFDALANDLMTPKKIGIELVNYGDTLSPKKECWFSGKCIAIRDTVFTKILSQLQQQDYPIHKTVLEYFGSDMKRATNESITN